VKVFATYNIKGGVGKTTTAVNLAYLSAVEGHRTLLWDLDPQGAASYLLRIKSRVKGGAKALIRGTRTLDDAVKGTDFDSLDLLPADFTYRNMDLELLRPLRDEYDVIFLDCPPSISLVSENVLHAVNRLLVPLIPTTLSLRTFDQLTGFIAELEEPRPGVLAFFNMVDRRKRLHRTVMAQLSADRRIAQTAIPALSIVEQMAVRRAPLPAFAPKDKAAQSYEALWRELQQQS